MDCDIVTGGGPGLMQAANEGARSADPEVRRKSEEIRVDLPFEHDVNAFVSDAFEHGTFFTRLHHFVLVSDAFLVRHPDLRPLARIAGWGHQTVGLGLQQKLDHAADQPYVMPHLRRAVHDAFDRAQIGLDDLDALETHDCFTPSEYIAIDHIGLTEPGESWKAIENGDIEIGGRLPINPSGGLIGGGHPVGASGIRMVLDATKQVAGTAGDYQVDGADTVGTLNFGGSTATTVSFVVTAH
jgi:acetyl-CoA C-acetyltransferase